MHQAKDSATSQNATWKHTRRHNYGLGKLLLVVIRYRLTVAIGTLILLVGICLTLWMAARADRLMRDEMLRQACLVAEAINLDLVQALTGTEADLESPEFLRLKDQFACVRSANPGYRFIYLMGRKTDGTVIFLNDDEPLDIEDFTPPGTSYEEVPEGYLRVFDTRVSAIIGPVTDRWGTFITALVPLIDPHSRDLVAILGIDIIVRDWIWDLCTQTALPVGLFTLALLLVLTIGSWLLAWRSCSEGPPPWTQHLEPALTIAIGLVLTIFATWFAHETESRNRSQSFRNLADSRTAAVEDTFRDLRYVELEGLARFYEESAEVTEREYRHYTEYLSQNPLIQAWGWIPVVPASEKDRFEQTARAAGMDDFGIWQRNATGSRMPAAGREVYYPVFQVAPLTSNQQDIGFDLGSEPVNREAIAEAIRTGMTSATYPAVLIKENLNQHGMLIFRPVFDNLQPQNPQGLALAVLRLSDVLTTAYYDPLIAQELLIAYSDGTPESLIVSWSSADTPPPSQLKASRPIMAFGKTLIVTAYAGPDFLRLHPTRAGPLATFIGLLLTAAVTIVVSVLLRRHRGLEDMVRQRTSALRSSEEHLAATLRSIGDGVITCDRAGRISSLNTVAERLTGWTTTEATNHPIEEIFRIINAQTRQVAVNPVECALREGQTADLANHTALIARNGTEYQIAHSCAPIRDDGGTIIGAVLVFRDVTEEYCRREELAEERQRIEHILSVTKTGINITDPQFNLRYVDPAWQKIYGNPAGRKCYEYFMRLDRPCPGCGIPQALATKQPVVSEEVLPLENNRTVEVHTIPFQDSNGQWLVAEFNVDITERKRTEESLLETNRRLTEATAEANAMAVQAKLANAAKSEFLANMSHEIRTPMTAILGYADLIGECCPGQCAYGREEMRKGIGTVQRNGRHLLEIINNILDLSKIEADKMTVEMVPVSPHAIVAEVESLVRVRAEANNLVFNCEFLGPVPETIRTDPLRVRQILVNLLGNSIKFTDTGGIRLLVCMVDEDSKPCLQFDVLDTGIGMTAEQAQNIFQPFSQVDNSMTRRFGGTGLGLTISKRLAQMLGGDVFLLHSQPGLGTRFRLILPIGPLADIRMIEGNDNAEALVVQREQGPAILSPVAGDKTLNGLRILLAEDSPDNQRLISFVLKKSGACITTVDNGRMAVDTALAHRDTGKPFDVILMDMQMPIMDGYMAATTLRGQGYAGPIIALTAHAMASDRKKCIDAGCDEYVTKPIDRFRLIEVIVSTRNEASLLPTTSIPSQPTQDAYP